MHRPTDQAINRPTDRPCPSQSRDIDRLHVPTLPHWCARWTLTRAVDDGKAKSRGDTRTTKCEAGKRDRRRQRRAWETEAKREASASLSVSPSFFTYALPLTPYKLFSHFLYNAQHVHTADLRTRNEYGRAQTPPSRLPNTAQARPQRWWSSV